MKQVTRNSTSEELKANVHSVTNSVSSRLRFHSPNGALKLFWSVPCMGQNGTKELNGAAEMEGGGRNVLSFNCQIKYIDICSYSLAKSCRLRRENLRCISVLVSQETTCPNILWGLAVHCTFLYASNSILRDVLSSLRRHKLQHKIFCSVGIPMSKKVVRLCARALVIHLF